MSESDVLIPHSSKAETVIAYSILLVLLLGMFTVFGYYNYLHDEAREQACQEQYGEGSNWAGNSAEFGSSGIICETPSGELKQVKDVSTLPVSIDTLSGYLGRLGGAVL